MDQTATATAKKLNWEDDHLGRKADAANILRMIDNRAKRMKDRGDEGAVVLNLDASWGEGKTFLLQRMQAELEEKGRLVASVNAWELDYDDDPFPALIGPIARALQNITPSEIITQPKQQKSALQKLAEVAFPIGWAAAKGGFKQGMKLAFGGEAAGTMVEIAQSALESGTDATLDKIEAAGAALLNDDQDRRDAITAFKKEIANQLASIKSEKFSSPIKLIILVDELDRCRPIYAISMLERIKHLFDIEGVAFVVATDTKQLCASIKGVYGISFEAEIYLRRFFPLSYRLSKPSMQQLVSEMFSRLNYDLASMFGSDPHHAPEYVAAIFAAFGCSTRDAIQHLAHVDMAIEGFAQDRVFYPLVLIECICQQRLNSTSKQIYSQGEPIKHANLKVGNGFITIQKYIEGRGNVDSLEDAVSYANNLMFVSNCSFEELKKATSDSHFYENIYSRAINMLFASPSSYRERPKRIDLEGIVASCGMPTEAKE